MAKSYFYIEVELEVEYEYSPSHPGVLDALPENCYDGTEEELELCDVFYYGQRLVLEDQDMRVLKVQVLEEAWGGA